LLNYAEFRVPSRTSNFLETRASQSLQSVKEEEKEGQPVRSIVCPSVFLERCWYLSHYYSRLPTQHFWHIQTVHSSFVCVVMYRLPNVDCVKWTLGTLDKR
jgi:hypothetical protein